MEAAAAVEFHTLSHRELQALCKRNDVRANMTNVAMADALQNLTSTSVSILDPFPFILMKFVRAGLLCVYGVLCMG
jgi:hypothetical protein